jgi:uncharacterized protein
MEFTVTPLYAALCGLLLIFLSMRIPPLRRKLSVGLGYGDDRSLEQAIRVHGNFIEYVPLALILLAFTEAGGVAALYLHLAGGTLLIGRLLHAFGLSQSSGVSTGRFVGTLFTWLVIISLSIYNLVGFFR